jgi:hypothetical protein
MGNAAEPQTDRELLLEVRNRVEMVTVTFEDKIDKLADAINRAVANMQTIEEKRIVKLEERADRWDERWQELSGAKKIVIAMWVVAAAIGGLIAKFLFK